jgi:hypothetical protein
MARLWCPRCINRTIRGVAKVDLVYDPGREREQFVDLLTLLFDIAGTPNVPPVPTVPAEDVMRGWPAETAIHTLGRVRGRSRG